MINYEELKSIPTLIEKTFPIPARFRSKLPSDIAELSRLLTNTRRERTLSYLNRPNLLSAYLYYYMPWNIYRLCLLLPSLDISLAGGDTVLDLGSGTLTFVSALWIARPDLRNTPLEFNCVDRSGQALEAGKKFFFALCGNTPWKIKLIKENLNLTQRKPCNAKLITAVNLFNEIYENISHSNLNELKSFAKNTADFLNKQSAENSCILTVEPGVPVSGKFISFLRSAFLKLGRQPASPCTHCADCPMISGAFLRAKKWCHFAHEEFEPPKDLAKLSAAAKLPKQRLVYSYLFAGGQQTSTQKKEKAVRIISDAFSLPGGKIARYGCGENGLVLLSGDKAKVNKAVSGSMVLNYSVTDQVDEKSGAVIIKV